MKTAVETPDITKEVMTWQQIKDKVGNSGWAIIKNPIFNGCIFLKGEMLFHSNNEDEVFDKRRVINEKDVYIKYCGKRDPNIVHLL